MVTPGITEAHIQRGLRDWLANLGYDLIYHTQHSLHSDKGFPDLIAVRSRDGALVAVECKGPKGRIRDRQRDWIDGFAMVPGCRFAGIVGPSPGEHWLGYDEALLIIEGASRAQ